MSEVLDMRIEVKPSRHHRLRLLLAPVLAGLTLAACTTGSGSSIGSAAPTQSVHQTSRGTVTASVSPTTNVRPQPTSSSTTSKQPTVEGLAGCAPYFDLAKYPNHEYEVCTAYINNSAQIALQGFYKFGNSTIGYLSAAARHHFETRYWNQPRQAIEQRVDAWPKTTKFTGNRVEQTVTLLSLSSSEQADRGVLKTEESWKVTAPDGSVLYNEPLHQKEATLCRGKLPGHPLHEWVVVSNSQIPDYNCIGFDAAHGLKP